MSLNRNLIHLTPVKNETIICDLSSNSLLNSKNQLKCLWKMAKLAVFDHDRVGRGLGFWSSGYYPSQIRSIGIDAEGQRRTPGLTDPRRPRKSWLNSHHCVIVLPHPELTGRIPMLRFTALKNEGDCRLCRDSLKHGIFKIHTPDLM